MARFWTRRLPADAVEVVGLETLSEGYPEPSCFSEYPDVLRDHVRRRLVLALPGEPGGPLRLYVRDTARPAVQNLFLGVGDFILFGDNWVKPLAAAEFHRLYEA